MRKPMTDKHKSKLSISAKKRWTTEIMSDHNKQLIKDGLNKKYGSKYTVTLETIGCEYKDVVGFSRYIATKDGRIFYKIDETTFRDKKYSTDKNSYQIICLTGDDGKNKVDYVHRFIAKTWVENPNNNPEVDHIDNNRQNHDSNNLRWVTRLENLNNRKRVGRKPKESK